tara:strand:+ start:108 stop:983 length:876 start_codon:yes stop_codon:yes gene_type:complete
MSEAHHLFCHRDEEPEKKVLYIVGTPIGNLLDLSPRAINILKNVSLICCEDTRNTKKLLNIFKIKNRLISLNQHNINSKIESILTKLKSGESIAIVSDAGMPLINDPGDKLVKSAKNNFLDVICIPGPCAALTALVCSGFPCSKFIFYGFIAKNKKDRREILENIKRSKYPSILYESPKRILKLLVDLKEICGGQREINLARELTKKFERHYGPNISEVLKSLSDIEPKGEFTLIVNGYEEKELSNLDALDNIKKDLLDLMKAGLSHSSAANYLAKKHNIAKNKIYSLITH